MTVKSLVRTGWLVHWAELVERIQLVRSYEETQTLMSLLASTKKPTIVAFANAHTFNELCKTDFALTIQRADVVLRDGVGVSSLLRLAGKNAGLNMNGTDLIPRLIEYLAPEKLALFGTEEKFVQSAADSLTASLPTASDIYADDGFKSTEHYISLVKERRPNVVVLGMGVPRQEEVGGAIAMSIDFPCVIICGGAILDFLGGRVVRAPYWIRAARSEWLYRLFLEPRRLFRRYVLGVPLFCARALIFLMHRARPSVFGRVAK